MGFGEELSPLPESQGGSGGEGGRNPPQTNVAFCILVFVDPSFPLYAVFYFLSICWSLVARILHILLEILSLFKISGLVPDSDVWNWKSRSQNLGKLEGFVYRGEYTNSGFV